MLFSVVSQHLIKKLAKSKNKLPKTVNTAGKVTGKSQK